MKHWHRTLASKIICFILCIITLAVAAGCTIGAILLIEGEFYTRTEEFIAEDVLYGEVYSDGYDIMHDLLNDTSYALKEHQSNNTNLRYTIISPDGSILSTNDTNTDPKWKYDILYYVVESYGRYYISTISIETAENTAEVYTAKFYLAEGLPIADNYALVNDLIRLAYSLRYAVYPIGLVSLILSAVIFCTLMAASARRPHSEDIHPGVLNSIPFDLLAAISAAITVFLLILFDSVNLNDTATVAFFVLLIAVIAAIVLGLCMSIAARIKQKNLFTYTVVWITLKKIWQVIKATVRATKWLFRQIPMIWKALIIALVVTVLNFIEMMFAASNDDMSVVMFFLMILLFTAAPIYFALVFAELKRSGDALAKGELEHKTDTKRMFGELKAHGENLNRIADGMAVAVEQRLKSERTKAELITKVSHDIKTPLTSIINYAGLISEKDCECAEHKEYAEVLTRKSEHLKRLLEDIVEISKATTGNLEVTLAECEAGVLLMQAAGEFEQKCRENGLELITNRPADNIKIMADSRRIWRVFENLMNNACKYSLPGSRVYLSLNTENGNAEFVFRNTSRTALNISPEELTERFVRGDSSRSTDGNGLGLSIAQSLTELQNGKMNIAIDGDLFKVTLSFPIVK